MEQVAKLKRIWNLVPVLQIIQKSSENYCSCMYLSIDHVLWLNELWFKRDIQKHTVSCTNTHHHAVTDLVTQGMAKKIQKREYLENRTELFYEIKKPLTCASDDTFSKVTVLK